MDYLELVNLAIQEAGVDLDDLTEVNFDNPVPTKMYPRFKNWVNKAWEDLQVDNNDWEFSAGTAVVTIMPKLLVSSGNRASDPPQDSEFVSDSGNVLITVDSVETLSGSWSLGTAEAFLSLSSLEGTEQAIFLERYSETTPSVASAVFQLKYWGRYNLQTLVSDLEVADYESFIVQDPDTGQNRKLTFIPWEHWQDTYESIQDSRGCPIYLTETPEGYIDFYPRPDRDYTLTFTYTKATNTLEDYSDVPTGLDERYHKVLAWAAVMSYADYDENQKLWVKAKRQYDKYIFSIDRDYGPKPSFGRSLY